VLIRLQNALLAVTLLAVWLLRRRTREAAHAFGWLALAATALGAIDAWTWGRWFNSAITYVDFNVMQGGASGWGVSPWWFYFDFFWRSMGPAAAMVAGLALIGLGRAPTLTACTVVLLASHVAVGHKESRFVFGVVPLAAALAAVGAAELRGLLTRHGIWQQAGEIAWTLIVVLSATLTFVSAIRFHQLTWGDVKMEYTQNESAYDVWGNETRLLLTAYGISDLCGIREDHNIWAFTGGYAYLHRSVPFYDQGGPGPESGYYNYVLSRSPDGGVVVARQGDIYLKKIRDGCVRDPTYRRSNHR
jgi:hypothetical protein